jgi:uncharacterized protein YecE (DUF72 family)
MDFGKLTLAELEKADLGLPPDNPFTQKVLQAAERHPPRVYVGCPVWADKTWVGKLYPSHAKDKDFLRLYARQFNTIELNITHYRIPDEALIEEWRSAVPEGFTFCPKFPQVISHDKLLQESEGLTELFCEEVLRLGPHLGMPFLQLAPYFGPRQISILEQYLRKLPPDFPLAVEFRHQDWFAHASTWEQALSLLHSYRVATVITDVAGRRDVVHQSLSTPTAVVRFVGNELHPSDYQRVDEWVERLKGWFEQGLQTLYFFVHCGSNHYAPDLALYFIRQLNAVCGLSVPEPKLLPQVVQTSLF